MKVIVVIPQNQAVFEDNPAGKELQTTLKEIDPICKLITKLNRKATIA